MNRDQMELQGIFCPVTTPFVENRVSPEKLAHNLNWFNATELKGYVLFGSTGEAPYVSIPERIELIKAARNLIPSDTKKLIVGTGYETTDDTVAFTKQAADCGADCALVLTPSYYKKAMNDVVLIQHFTAVADKSPIPVLLYNVPPFTGVDMSFNAVTTLADHPNIVGIKDSTADMKKLLSLIQVCSKKLSILIGNALFFPTGLLSGAQGAILAAANVVPGECVEVFQNYDENVYAKAKSALAKITSLVTQVILPHGIPAIKAVLDLRGYYGGPPRAPLLPVSDEVRQSIEAHLAKLELLADEEGTNS
jgi:4-hydroxy-2-oxoglutarate aldolase